MILPTKGITAEQALITVGAKILKLLDRPKTISRLWDEIRIQAVDIRFDWFVLGLDLLYLFGAVEIDRGRVHKATTHASVEGGS